MGMETVGRRAFLSGLGGAALLAAAPRGAGAASDETLYELKRGGASIGTHRILSRREGADVALDMDLRIRVTLLGLPVFRYEAQSRERWRDGRLVSFESVIHDDGHDLQITIGRDEGGRLIVRGPEHQGEAPDDAALTSYWSTEFLSRPVWIHTQTGKLMSISLTAIAPPEGAAAAWRASDGGRYNVEAWYDGDNRLLGVSFDGKGERVTYQPQRLAADYPRLDKRAARL